MKKVLLIDLDGVILQARHKYFSQRLAEEYNIPLENIMEFFKGEYGQAARGQVSIRDVLPKYLEKWRTHTNIDEFLLYWFEGEKEVDVAVINRIAELRALGVKVYIVSDNEKERVEYLNRELNLPEIVDGAFYSYQLGKKKSEPEFFTHVLTNLETSADHVVYWDDDAKNVEIAAALGIDANVFTTALDFQENTQLR